MDIRVCGFRMEIWSDWARFSADIDLMEKFVSKECNLGNIYMGLTAAASRGVV